MNTNQPLDMELFKIYLQKVKERTKEIADKKAQICKLKDEIGNNVDDIISISSHMESIINNYQMDVYEIYDTYGDYLHGNATVVFADRELAEKSIKVNNYTNAKIRVINGASNDTDFEFFNRVYTDDGP